MPSCPAEEFVQNMKIFMEAFPELRSDLDRAREFAEAVHRTSAIHSNAPIHPAPARPDTVRGVHPRIVDLTTPCQRTQGSKLADTPASVASSKTGSTGMTSKKESFEETLAKPINTFILSSIAHGVLKRKSALKEDGSLPDTVQNVKLFDEGREDAAAAHTCTHSDLPEPLQGKKAYRDEIQTLMKQIRQRRNAKKGPKSFKECLQLIQPGHRLLATSQVSPQPDHAIGIQGTRTDAKDSTRPPPLKLQDTTRPSSLDAGVSKEGCESQWSVRTKVTLVGHRKYISTAQKKVDGDEEADEWVLMADGPVVSNPCAGGEGCDCPVRHVGIECVYVCVTAVRNGAIVVSTPEPKYRDVAHAAMGRILQNRADGASMNVLVGDRLECWPVMLLEPDVQVKKEATSKGRVKRARKPARSKQEEDTRGDAAPPPQKPRVSSTGRTIKPTKR